MDVLGSRLDETRFRALMHTLWCFWAGVLQVLGCLWREAKPPLWVRRVIVALVIIYWMPLALTRVFKIMTWMIYWWRGTKIRRGGELNASVQQT
ncbi:hypothetical protein BKA56DRAFT_597489 [Ilyonectria sp. MPI-CAGE-AT-0026]|nr:hypothetical protein BKA56DRAFT_597489 [Ilyonectria sp. MPI-CAGE-AT-0026]